MQTVFSLLLNSVAWFYSNSLHGKSWMNHIVTGLCVRMCMISVCRVKKIKNKNMWLVKAHYVVCWNLESLNSSKQDAHHSVLRAPVGLFHKWMDVLSSWRASNKNTAVLLFLGLGYVKITMKSHLARIFFECLDNPLEWRHIFMIS